MKNRQFSLLALFAVLSTAAVCNPKTPTPPAPTVQQVTVALTPPVANCAFHLAGADPGSTYSADFQQPGNPYAPANFQLVPWALLHVTASVTCTGYTSSPVTVGTAGDGHTAITLTLTPTVPPLPPVPTRDQLLRVHAAFQGLTVTTQQLGSVPSWGPEAGMLTSAADRHATYAAHKAAGATHFVLAVTCHYTEPGVAYPNATACSNDWSTDPETLAARVGEVVKSGLYVVLMQGGDELPWATVRAQMPAWYAALKNSPDGDLTPYVVWCLGFDSIVPMAGANDTTDQDLIDTILATRAVIGNGAQVIEYPNGWAFWGPTDAKFNLAGPGSYTSTAGQALDGVLQEFANDSPGNEPPPAVKGSTWDMEHGYSLAWASDPSPWEQIWQIAARSVPSYTAPADQPFNITVTAAGGGPQDGQQVVVSSDRQNAKSYAAGVTTPRGRFYFIGFEIATYQHTHGQTTAARVQRACQYIFSVGYDAVSCPGSFGQSGQPSARVLPFPVKPPAVTLRHKKKAA